MYSSAASRSPSPRKIPWPCFYLKPGQTYFANPYTARVSKPSVQPATLPCRAGDADALERPVQNVDAKCGMASISCVEETGIPESCSASMPSALSDIVHSCLGHHAEELDFG